MNTKSLGEEVRQLFLILLEMYVIAGDCGVPLS